MNNVKIVCFFAGLFMVLYGIFGAHISGPLWAFYGGAALLGFGYSPSKE